MPRTKEQFEAMREATREKIHSAAIKLFSEKGLSATTVREIAGAAQISMGSLYQHYKSKDEIFGALVKEGIEGLEKTGQLFESDMAPTDVIRIFTEEIITGLSEDEEFLQYMILLLQPFIMNQDFPWMKELMERDKIMIDQIAGTIKCGQDSGHFKKGDPVRMAQFYLSSIQGVCIVKHFFKEAFIPPTADMMTDFLMKEKQDESR